MTRLPPTGVRATARMPRGAAAEELACAYLAAQGCRVVERNLRCRAGEIDLVCLDAEVLLIVEVRQRSGAAFGGAPASVTWRKQRRLIRATLFEWQRRAEWHARALRFDVIAVHGSEAALQRIEWIKDAFRLPA